MNASTIYGTTGTRTHLRHVALATVAFLICAMATVVMAADLVYTYDELGRVVRVFDPAGADITYSYDAAGNVTVRTVIHDTDMDGDPNGTDCNPSDATVFSGAPEINDGIDNQCPGDLGYGIVDEVEGGVFLDKTTLGWTPQPGATTYEIAWATSLDFTKDCAYRYEISAQATVTEVPDPGEVIFYVIRSVQPNLGSWGAGTGGIERTVGCSPSGP